MTLRDIPPTDFDALGRRNRWTWTWALAAALVLNLGFFAGMPHLLQRESAKPQYESPVVPVNVIRIRRPEPPVRRKPPPPPEPRMEKSKPQATVESDLPLKLRLKLPFEINPRLPAGPATLALPVPETELGDFDGAEVVFEAGALDAPLTVLARIPPLYPLDAKRRGIEGWVTIGFVVNREGAVEELTVLESRPPGVFEPAVRSSVLRWRFQPGTVEGIPVRTRAETTIRFELK